MMSRSIMLLVLFVSINIFVVAKVKGSDFPVISNQIHLLRPQSGSGGGHVKGVSCLSWRYGVETNSIINWKTIPVACEDYVGHYMLGDQYRKDSKAINDEAFLYVKTLNLSKKAANDVVWVFDIDETTLSNLPYYAQHGFGVERFNATSFNEWVFTGKAVALPESLKLYKKLVRLKVKIVFLTGRTEDQRTVTETNLRSVGYNSWDKLLLKGKNFVGKPAAEYKSAQRKILEKEGYKIIGNMGDQWSDLLGTNIGLRTFKLPDPMYYIS
ncbi:acid phosphatase 1 [Cannabis sativa]|uniref:acid phosphatase 1 n=1 Tax=Cannabis sativa TaxID=3483 RepID=UPI0029CA8303|nr:acid phosphatase 1 [Cannabis sativa]